MEWTAEQFIIYGKEAIKFFLNPYLNYRIDHRKPPIEFIFVMAHMRSGSTLLTHILSSHPEVAGYSESNYTYRSARQLKEHIRAVHYIQRDLKFCERYVVDQINHNEYTPDFTWLVERGVKFIFLIREPRESLSSIIKLKEPFGWGEQQAAQYYIKRLRFLVACAQQCPLERLPLFVTYHDLIDNTSGVLKALQNFTGVQSAFSEKYSVTHTTGKQGDPSSNIKAGAIVRNRKKELRPVNTQLLGEAEEAYQRCSTALTPFGVRAFCRPE